MKSRRWKTWAKHSLICGAIVFVGSLVVPTPEAVRIGAAFYLLRELDQQRKRWRTNGLGDWIGAVGDVGSAWVGAAAMWWLL